MEDLANKMLVRHVSLGVGKVIAVEPNAAHVFFAESDNRFATKLRLPAARALLRTEGVERNAWLEGLSDFSFDEKAGRYGLAATWLTHDQAVAQFLAAFPQGFSDPKHTGAGVARAARAPQWRAAHDEWDKALGGGEGERLLAADDLRELVRRALRVAQHVSSLEPVAEKDGLKEALADGDAARAFFAAVFELLGERVPGRAGFEKLFAASEHLPVPPASRWPMATLFPFVAEPARHVFLQAKPTCAAAARLGCDLRFDEKPNWATYAALRKLSARLLEDLAASGARDFVDVESFLYVTAKRASRPRSMP